MVSIKCDHCGADLTDGSRMRLTSHGFEWGDDDRPRDYCNMICLFSDAAKVVRAYQGPKRLAEIVAATETDRHRPKGGSMSEKMEPLEAEYRKLIPWAVKETVIRVPRHLHSDHDWRWDAHEERLYALADDGEFSFHVELTVGRTRVHTAVLSVTDDDGSATWEARIPGDVVAAAKGAPDDAAS